MVDGTRAAARLERLLHVLPAASREGGASIRVLAQELGTTPARILDDLEEATNRIFYHPGGWPDDLRIEVGSERVRVVHAHGLDRPVRLNERELLCLALALRGGAAAARLRDDDARRTLLERAEARLAAGGRTARRDGTGQGPAGGAKGEERATGAAGDDGPADEGGNTGEAGEAGPTSPARPAMDAPDRAPDPEEVRETVMAAARARTPCGILYVKDGADDAEGRLIHPYVVAYADGSWYTVGWCAVSEGVRVFRVDRILEAAPAEGTFQVPEDFDPSPFFDGGTVYHATEDREVRVRYSPKVARWVRERAGYRDAEIVEDGDGGIVLRHRVADPRWVVSHALQYGPDAEILDPPEMRALVREVVEGMKE